MQQTNSQNETASLSQNEEEKITVAEIVGDKDVTDMRKETLQIAIDNGASREQITQIRDAVRASRKETIVLPFHRFELLSRGRGWARKGNRDKAVWGEREDKGYRVGAGSWTVGGNDGFSRKGETKWEVKNIAFGGVTFTIAN